MRCTSCGVGKYNDQVGEDECKVCDKGNYQEKIGATHCKKAKQVPKLRPITDLQRRAHTSAADDDDRFSGQLLL